MSNITKDFDRKARRGMAQHLVPGRSGEDKVPAKLTHGEAVLPVKTVRALGARNIAKVIEQTNDGKKPQRGLRPGGRYATGVVPEYLAPNLRLPDAEAQAAAPVPAPAQPTSAQPTSAARSKIGGLWDGVKGMASTAIDTLRAPAEAAPEVGANGRFGTPPAVSAANEVMKWSAGGSSPEVLGGLYQPTSYGTQVVSDAAKLVPKVARGLGAAGTVADIYNRANTVRGVVANPNATAADVGTAVAEQGSQMAGGLAGAGAGGAAALTYGAPLIAASGPLAPVTATALGLGGAGLGYLGGQSLVKGVTYGGRKLADAFTGGDTANAEPPTPATSVLTPARAATPPAQVPAAPVATPAATRTGLSAAQPAISTGSEQITVVPVNDARRSELAGLQRAREAAWRGPGEEPGHWRQGVMPNFGRMSTEDLLNFRGQAAAAGDWTGLLASRDAMRYRSMMDNTNAGRSIAERTLRAQTAEKVKDHLDKLLDRYVPTAGLKDDALAEAQGKRSRIEQAMLANYGGNMPTDLATFERDAPEMLHQARLTEALNSAVKNRGIIDKARNALNANVRPTVSQDPMHPITKQDGWTIEYAGVPLFANDVFHGDADLISAYKKRLGEQVKAKGLKAAKPQ